MQLGFLKKIIKGEKSAKHPDKIVARIYWQVLDAHSKALIEPVKPQSVAMRRANHACIYVCKRHSGAGKLYDPFKPIEQRPRNGFTRDPHLYVEAYCLLHNLKYERPTTWTKLSSNA